jgi:RNA polymerase sigma-70 factor (ECF subfamily)
MIAHSEDRKDIAQDVYLKAYSKLSGFKFQSKLSTWIGQIAYNSCLNHLEKKKLLYPGDIRLYNDSDKATGAMGLDLGGYESERVLSRKETTAILQSAIEQLNPIYKTLITLYHQEGLNYEEIMTITGLPEGTVKNYLFRARKSLKDGILVRYKKEEL